MTSITIATPMFGGQCHGGFLKSLLNTFINLGNEGYKVNYIDLYNESLITRARNSLTHMFLHANDSDYLLFIDADQSFRWEDIKRMVDADADVISAPVPMKRINWEQVSQAAAAGVEPSSLELFSGYFNVNFKEGQERLPVDELATTKYSGSGMILIKRSVFEAIADSVGEYVYDGGNLGNILEPGKTKIKNFWSTEIVDGRLLSEDYYFSKLVQDAGIETSIDLQSRVFHHGTYTFAGSLLAQTPSAKDRVSNTPAKKAPAKKAPAKKAPAKK